MKPHFLLALALVLAGCSALPEQGPPMKTLAGTLVFPAETALPSTATARVSVMPLASAEAKPVAAADFPARTGSAIPFELKIPAGKVAGGGEYLVFAQVLDHGKVWYSNLASPLRISFLADPGPTTIELRPERF
jgi:uncharacterized lipoprotein YbaY